MSAPKCPKCGKRTKPTQHGAHCACGWSLIILPKHN